MASVAAVVGLGSFVAMLVAVASLMRQLGAGEAAKGLLILTGIVFAAAAAVTYLPSLVALI
ncbi:MAG: hypothetical protein ACFB00_04000 [Parvularculaceae bacterium]